MFYGRGHTRLAVFIGDEAQPLLSWARPPLAFTVYALIDPRDLQIRYVGCFSWYPGEIHRRIWGHVANAKRDASTPAMAWMRELVSADLRPTTEILEVLYSRDEASAAEKWWIESLRNRGYKLTNVRRGGIPTGRRVIAADKRMKNWFAETEAYIAKLAASGGDGHDY